jgi:hypothetical protein
MCVPTPPVNTAIVGVSLLTFLFIAAIFTYVFIVTRISRTGNIIRRGITTLSLFLAHFQTIALLSGLRLRWPASVRAVCNAASFSFLDHEFIRPECLTRRGTNAFLLFTYIQVCTTLGGLSILAFMSLVATNAKRADGFHFLLTITLSAIFTMSWRLMFRVLEQASVSAEFFNIAMLAALLVFLEFCLVIRYACFLVCHESAAKALYKRSEVLATLRNKLSTLLSPCPLLATQRCKQQSPNDGDDVRMLSSDAAPQNALPKAPPKRRMKAVRQLLFGKSTQPQSAIPSCDKAEQPMSQQTAAEHIERRLYFLTKRYAAHAKHWQFVVWGRQFALFLCCLPSPGSNTRARTNDTAQLLFVQPNPCLLMCLCPRVYSSCTVVCVDRRGAQLRPR